LAQADEGPNTCAGCRDAIEGLRQPLEDVRMLERLASMDNPRPERLEFLG
jgi:hypothetical protein